MIIILPNEIDGLFEVEKKLQNIKLSDILNQGYEQEIQLYLPKFKVESEIHLNNVLQKVWYKNKYFLKNSTVIYIKINISFILTFILY